MSSNLLHLVEVEAIGARATIHLGGVPIFEHLDASPRVVRRSVGAELVAGSNTIVVELASAPPEPPPPDQDPELPQVRVGLYRVAPRTTQSRYDLIVEATWNEELCRLPSTGTIPLLRHRFGSTGAPGGTPWAGFDVMRDEDRSAVVGFVIELHQALGERNVARALELMSGTTYGRAKADGVDGEAAASDLALELENLFEDEGFEMMPIAVASLAIEKLRDGRIACVRDAHGAPAIMARQTRGSWHRAPVVSTVQGKVTMWC